MKKIAAILVSIVVLIIIFWLIHTIKFVSWDFRNNLWGPTHLIWSGESAYKIQTLFPDSNAIWFPQIIGLLSFQVAQTKPKPVYLGILVFTVFLFPPPSRI